MSTSLKNRAVRIKVVVGKPTGYVRDEELNDAVEKDYNTSNRSILHKRIFKKSRKFREVQSAYTNLYSYYKNNSLPWEDGARVIPSSDVLKVAAKIDQMKIDANAKLEGFLNNYHDEVQKDMQEANGMMRADDYLSPEELREKYKVEVKFMPIADHDDFRVVEGLEDSDVDKLVEDAKENLKQQQEQMARDTWNRLYKVVSHMKNRLSEYKGEENERLHKSLLTNITETIDILGGLNKVIGDSSLDQVMNELSRDVCPTDIEALKALPAKRKETINKVDEILNKMRFFGGHQQGEV